MKLKKIPISQLETFYFLVNNNSFTKAAHELGITKSAISHAIKSLEAELKVDLINRTTRSFELTHEGQLLYSHCLSLQNEIDNIRNLTDSFHAEPSGVLRINTTTFFAEQTLLPIIDKYTKKFPKVRIEINIEERLPSYQQQIDIIFGVNWTPSDDLVARKITNTRYILCASPEYLTSYGTPKNLQDLINHRYIPHTSRDRAIVSTKANTHIKISKPQISADNAFLLKKCALDGLGIIQVHEYIVKEELENGKLVEILSDELLEKQDVFMYYQKNKFVQPKIKEFVAVVLESLNL
ncbi:LysR family transcriptional regulator [Candidatus Francisella endociliophora]|uniref:LysR family transcriptional regulator n=1 Tax=Candidatus Francisella endociliophora TaxID=653937 RepID=A0A097EQ31_9GAMM|nr:LysR family transcriptional regulator [Francisella sp. FSC1006]AIT09675.1 LysR family transcriptional regulator [Francisella sp. FSC1006]